MSPATMSTLLLAGVAVLAAAIGTREFRRLPIRQLGDRAGLGGDAFFTQYYEAAGLKKEKVLATRKQVAEALEVPAELLRPEHRFDEELAPPEGWEVGWDDGLDLVRRGVVPRSSPLRNVDWSKVTTLDDVIRQTAAEET
jgi:hypothetical protein